MESLITQFYEAFQRLDGDAMAALYHDDIEFHDPAFGDLKGEQARNMWRMLCQSQQGKDFKVIFSNVQADGETGSAHWEAFYYFGKAQKKVHNSIEASFKFKDGKIIRHKDHFNLHKWSQQAMGLSGMMIGWTPFFRSKLRERTRSMLRKFEEKRGT